MSAAAQVIRLFDALPEAGQQFIRFWYLYPRRVGKHAAQRVWGRLPAPDREAALAALPSHVAHWQLSGTAHRYIPHPSTWLTQRRWEDELADLNQPLTSLGRCEWNRNGTREPGRGQCEADAIATAPLGHANAGHVYCFEHARRLGFARR